MGADEYFRCIRSVRLDLLELMGSGYVIEHCVATFSEYCKEQAFRIYMADGVKCISESVANYLGGSYLQGRYAEIIRGDDYADESATGDEIALDVIERAGLIIVRGD